MNWIKGLDRIILATSFIVLIVTFCFLFPETEHMTTRLAEKNPEYEKWYEEYGKNLESKTSGRFHFEFSDPKHPEPDKYLPIKIHRRIYAAGIPSLIVSVIWIVGLAGMTRIVKLTSKWIVKGFKE